ncbi:hypothetical protein MJG53_019030 [Ovis ammon polii x Ovis aries]|uniref:Uncharacterized protein n=1 Tax=Ovis ammon polii x Ovis aries TaxID=2918886 RepID=A0ACB9U4E2_9CETA|nr:hypothetical protein MJG53_019030 [Ovis ammon polii x Ovis aries]
MPEMQQQKTKFISRGLSTCQGILGIFFNEDTEPLLSEIFAQGTQDSRLGGNMVGPVWKMSSLQPRVTEDLQRNSFSYILTASGPPWLASSPNYLKEAAETSSSILDLLNFHVNLPFLLKLSFKNIFMGQTGDGCLVFFLKSRSTAASHAKVCSSSPRSTKAHTASTTAVKAVTVSSPTRTKMKDADYKVDDSPSSYELSAANRAFTENNGDSEARIVHRQAEEKVLHKWKGKSKTFQERSSGPRTVRGDVKNCKENCEVKYYRHRSFSSIKYLYFNKLKRRLIDTKLMAVKLLPLDASHPPFHSESSTGSISKPKQLSGAHCVALSCIRTSVSPKRRPKLDSAQCLKQSKVKKKVTGTFTVLSSADEDAKQLKHQALSASLGEIQLRQNSPKSICNRKPNSKEDPARGRVTKRKRYRYWGPEPQLRKLVRLEPVQPEKPLRGETGTERQGAAPSQRLEEAQMQPRRSSPAKI